MIFIRRFPPALWLVPLCWIALPVFNSSLDFSVVSPYLMDTERSWSRKHGATHRSWLLTF